MLKRIRRQHLRVQESAAPVELPAGAVQLAESHTLSEAEATGAGGRLDIGLITPGWGSSGYYSADVLEAAGAAGIFAAGTHMYLDHPGMAEQQDRPVRSVRDLAAVLTEDATWDGQQLRANVQVFGPYAEALKEMRDVIGVSIRADATVTTGEAEGRQGVIVSELLRAESVDFVTHAGRGGRILAVLESATPQRVAARAVGAGVQEATANDTREALQTALRDRFTGDRVYVWVRDFDEGSCWYELETPDQAGTYQLAYTIDGDGAVTLDAGDPTEVRARTEYVPVTPAGQSTTTQESEEDTMPQIEEARLRQLEADAGRVQQAIEAQAASDARAQAAETALQLRDAQIAARPIAVAVLTASESLPESARTRLAEAAVAGVTAGEAGAFDEAAFRTAVEAARTQAETELAEALAAAGAGTPTSLGARTVADAATTEAAENARARAFGRPLTEQKG